MYTTDLMKLVEVTKKLTAIVLEDDPETNELMCDAFENFFKKVYSAFEGETALEQYKKYQPDVIFIDIILPGKSGLEIAEEIKAINPKQIIIIVSASDDMGDITRAVELGVNGFIRKPINTDKLIDVLNDMVSDIERERRKFKRILKKRLKKELQKELRKELDFRY